MAAPGPDTPTDGVRAATGDDEAPPIDTSKPHPARRYDYLLGGKDNFAADRQSADQIAAAFPSIRTAAIENRRYMRRVVAFLTEAGIDQFLDIGTGIPTSPNVHEVAQAINPEARIVYVDNDPLVMVHARALMVSATTGTTDYVRADLRSAKAILDDPALRNTLDLSRPVGLLLIAVLHFLGDGDDPYGQVAHLVQAMPSGSFLALSHATFDPLPPTVVDQLTPLTNPTAGHGTFQPRTRDEVARFLDGLNVVEPGLVPIVDWQPEREPQPQASVEDTAVYGAVALLP